MEGTEILYLVALLAVNVLGFTGIVAVLGRRSAGEWSSLDKLRFLSMVRVSAAVLFAALLPFPFHYAGFRGHELWAWCSGIGAVLSLIAPALSLLGMRAMNAGGAFSDPDLSILALTYAILTAAGTPLLLTLNALGVLFERTFTPYLVGLLLPFGASVVFFIRLLSAATERGQRPT